MQTMTKSWTDERLEERFDRIDDRFDEVDRRFEAVDKRFDVVDRKFEAVDRRFDAVERKFEAVEQRMETGFGELRKEMHTRFDLVAMRLDGIQRTMIQFYGAVILALLGLIATQL